jgi:hypothetical protein
MQSMRRHGWIVPLYLLIALLYTFPMMLHMGDAIVGHGPDAYQSYWTMWWTRHALIERGHDSFQVPLMQHPFGLMLYFHVHNYLHSLLSIPVQLCCGTAAAYNVLVLFTFGLTGVSGYALALYLTSNRAAAFLAGLICAFNPYMALHLAVGQPYLLAIGWLILYVLLLLRGLREGWRWLLAAGASLVLVALTDWHYFLYALLLSGIVWLCVGIEHRSWRAFSRITARLLLVGGVAVLLLTPVLVPALYELAQRPSVPRPLWSAMQHSIDVLAYLLPSIYHPLWGAWASDIFYGRLVRPYIVGGIATLGYVPLLLALVGAVVARRRALLFVLIGGVFLVLTLGPFLQVNGWNSYRAGSPIPLPYLLLRELPLMNIQRVPSRFFVVVLLALGMLAAFGVAWLWQQPWVVRWTAWGRGLLLAALAALVLFEYWPQPFPMTPVGPEQVSPFFHQLAAEEEAAGALLEIPWLGNTSSFYQTYHQQPTVGGVISRTPPHPWRGGRFFDALLNVEADIDDVGVDDSPAALRAALRCNAIRYVVFYQQEEQRMADPAQQDKLEQLLFPATAPVYADAVLRAYALPDEAPADPYWTLAPGEWHDTERNQAGIAYRWAQDNHGTEGTLLIYPCGQQQAIVEFNIFSFAAPRTIQVAINGDSGGSFSLPAEQVRRVRLVVPLAAGVNQVTLRSTTPATFPAAEGFTNDDRPVSFNLSRVQVTAAHRRSLP